MISLLFAVHKELRQTSVCDCFRFYSKHLCLAFSLRIEQLERQVIYASHTIFALVYARGDRFVATTWSRSVTSFSMQRVVLCLCLSTRSSCALELPLGLIIAVIFMHSVESELHFAPRMAEIRAMLN